MREHIPTLWPLGYSHEKVTIWQVHSSKSMRLCCSGHVYRTDDGQISKRLFRDRFKWGAAGGAIRNIEAFC